MNNYLLIVSFTFLGLIMLAFGITATLLAPLNLYAHTSNVLGSAFISMAPKASYNLTLSRSIMHEKQVEVIVENGPWNYNSTWGHCYWIQQPFQITLLDGPHQDMLNLTTPHSPPTWTVFDIPESWSDLSAIHFSNPEDYPVSILVTISFNESVLNDAWLSLLYLGVASISTGILTTTVALIYSLKKRRLFEPGKEESEAGQREDGENRRIVLLLALAFLCLLVSFGLVSPAIGWFVSRYGAQFVHVLAVLVVYFASSYAYIHGRKLRWARSLSRAFIIVETLWLVWVLIALLLFIFAVRH
jgi:hypothetical protein